MKAIGPNGYLLLRNALNPKDVTAMSKCIQDGGVNYGPLLEIVKKRVLQPLGISSFTKIRVSDNNNSVDASAFHRDVISPHKDLQFPGYTVLTYLDETTMEFIPGSHISPSNPLAVTYRQAQKIVISPGDVLIFSSTLLHRGVFTEKLPHRRLIQVFEAYLNQSDANLWYPRIIHIPGDETHGKLMISMSRIPFFNWLVNTMGFLNAASGYGGAQKFLSKHAPDMWAFSSEGLCQRISVEPGTLQPINKYILMVPDLNDMPRHLISKWRWQLYNKQFTIYVVVMVLLLIVIVMVYTKVRM